MKNVTPNFSSKAADITHRSYLKSRAPRSPYSIPQLLSDRNSTLIYLVEISTMNDVSYMYIWSKHAVDRTHPKRTIFKCCTMGMNFLKKSIPLTLKGTKISWSISKQHHVPV